MKIQQIKSNRYNLYKQVSFKATPDEIIKAVDESNHPALWASRKNFIKKIAQYFKDIENKYPVLSGEVINFKLSRLNKDNIPEGLNQLSAKMDIVVDTATGRKNVSEKLLTLEDADKYINAGTVSRFPEKSYLGYLTRGEFVMSALEAIGVKNPYSIDIFCNAEQIQTH